MNPLYVFDACALIAFFADEAGADKVAEILAAAEKGRCSIFLNKVNLLEVYYGTWRKVDKLTADEIFSKVLRSPITVVDRISDDVFQLRINCLGESTFRRTVL